MIGILCVLFLGLLTLLALRMAEALERIAKGLTREEPQPFDYHAEEEHVRPRAFGSFFRSNQHRRQPGEGDDE